MASPAELLRAWLNEIDWTGFALAISDEELAEARADIPELALVSDEAMRNLLGAAATNGVTRLIQAAHLKLDLDGPGEDPNLTALATTIESVRIAHSLLESDRPEARARAAALLGAILDSWQRHVAL